MGFASTQLGPGEALVYKTRQSLFGQWGKMLVVGIMVSLWYTERSVLVVAALIYGFAWLRSLTSALAVTNKRVFATSGIIKNDVVEIKLQKVEGVVVQQSILGRVLRFGDITVAGAGNVMIPAHFAVNPAGFRNAATAAVDGDYGHLNVHKDEPVEEPEEEEPPPKKAKKAKRAKPQAEEVTEVEPLVPQRQRFVFPD